MPTCSSDLPSALIVQLARLGDLLQSLPVLFSLQERYPESSFDLLCPYPLESLAKMFPVIQKTMAWNGEDWHRFAHESNGLLNHMFPQVVEYYSHFSSTPYSRAFNLNNHPRSVLAAHLFSHRVIGAGEQGPLDRSLPPWVDYLRKVSRQRGENRIHLADAFCGVCGVRPPSEVPNISVPDMEMPTDFDLMVAQQSVMRIGIVIGAGDVDRRVPLATWRSMIERCLDRFPNCLCVLIGGAGEREAALVLEDQLGSRHLSRILNCVGRTTLPQLAQVFKRCQWVIGSDTGPLHLAVACGTRGIGWYFSRARVHETGPYGVGHYVWQFRGDSPGGNPEPDPMNGGFPPPHSWPVDETVELIHSQTGGVSLAAWELWESHHDEWGMWYSSQESPDGGAFQRKEVWERLSEQTSHQHVYANVRVGG